MNDITKLYKEKKKIEKCARALQEMFTEESQKLLDAVGQRFKSMLVRIENEEKEESAAIKLYGLGLANPCPGVEYYNEGSEREYSKICSLDHWPRLDVSLRLLPQLQRITRTMIRQQLEHDLLHPNEECDGPDGIRSELIVSAEVEQCVG